MRKGNTRIDLEFQKPQVKFIEQYRMRVSGNKDFQEYDIQDKVQKKVHKDDKKAVVDNNDNDEFDIANAQVVDLNEKTAEDGDGEGDQPLDMKQFKPVYQKKSLQTAESKPKPKNTIEQAIKKMNKPTILSFDQDDV